MNGERMQLAHILSSSTNLRLADAKAPPDTRWFKTGVPFRLRAFPFAPPLESETR
jgi:hypothetical protein